MFTHTHSESVKVGAGGVDIASSAESVSAEQKIDLDIDVGATVTDLEIAFALDISQVKSIVIKSAANMVLETNDGAAPGDTLNLVGGKAYRWSDGSYDDLKFTTDITALFATNPGAAVNRLQVSVLVDPTL